MMFLLTFVTVFVLLSSLKLKLDHFSIKNRYVLNFRHVGFKLNEKGLDSEETNASSKKMLQKLLEGAKTLREEAKKLESEPKAMLTSSIKPSGFDFITERNLTKFEDDFIKNSSLSPFQLQSSSPSQSQSISSTLVKNNKVEVVASRSTNKNTYKTNLLEYINNTVINPPSNISTFMYENKEYRLVNQNDIDLVPLKAEFPNKSIVTNELPFWMRWPFNFFITELKKQLKVVGADTSFMLDCAIASQIVVLFEKMLSESSKTGNPDTSKLMDETLVASLLPSAADFANEFIITFAKTRSRSGDQSYNGLRILVDGYTWMLCKEVVTSDYTDVSLRQYAENHLKKLQQQVLSSQTSLKRIEDNFISLYHRDVIKDAYDSIQNSYDIIESFLNASTTITINQKISKDPSSFLDGVVIVPLSNNDIDVTVLKKKYLERNFIEKGDWFADAALNILFDSIISQFNIVGIDISYMLKGLLKTEIATYLSSMETRSKVKDSVELDILDDISDKFIGLFENIQTTIEQSLEDISSELSSQGDQSFCNIKLYTDGITWTLCRIYGISEYQKQYPSEYERILSSDREKPNSKGFIVLPADSNDFQDRSIKWKNSSNSNNQICKKLVLLTDSDVDLSSMKTDFNQLSRLLEQSTPSNIRDLVYEILKYINTIQIRGADISFLANFFIEVAYVDVVKNILASENNSKDIKISDLFTRYGDLLDIKRISSVAVRDANDRLKELSEAYSTVKKDDRYKGLVIVVEKDFTWSLYREEIISSKTLNLRKYAETFLPQSRSIRFTLINRLVAISNNTENQLVRMLADLIQDNNDIIQSFLDLDLDADLNMNEPSHTMDNIGINQKKYIPSLTTSSLPTNQKQVELVHSNNVNIASNVNSPNNSINLSTSTELNRLLNTLNSKNRNINKENESEDENKDRNIFGNFNVSANPFEMMKSMFSNITEENDLTDTNVVPKSLAELTIYEIFDKSSFQNGGSVVTRDGAGLFQSEVLRDLFTVTDVKEVSGSYILQGNLFNKNPTEFMNQIAIRVANSTVKDYIDYIVLLNEQYPSMDDQITTIAWAQLGGSSPAVVLYPKSWKLLSDSQLNDNMSMQWSNIITNFATITTTVCSTRFYNIFPDEAMISQSFPTIPIDVLYMALGAVLIPFIASYIERSVGNAKGLIMKGLLLPSFFLTFNHGYRNAWLGIPKTRNDVFDIALSNIGTSLILSLVALYSGLYITDSSTADVVNSFPSIPASLIQTNSILIEIVSSAFHKAQDNGLASEIGKELGNVPSESNIHLHWLAIVGAASFISTIFQILPSDNSPGSKMSFATLGLNNWTFFNTFAVLFRGLFILVSIFTLRDLGPNIITKSRLLLDYILSNQVTGRTMTVEIAKDNLSDISEGRKIIYLAIVLLTITSFLPISFIRFDIGTAITEIIQYIKALATSPSIVLGNGNSNNLF